MKGLRLLALIGVSTIALTAACGGSSEDQKPASGDSATSGQAAPAKPSGGLSLDSVRSDPCQLVTKAEAEVILGAPTQRPSKGMATGTVEASCFYSVETAHLKGSELPGAANAGVNIMFSPERAKGGMNGTKYMENARKGVTAHPVAGVGDEAFCLQEDPASPPLMIFAREGDIVVSVISKNCAMATEFAEKALARL
jgi:hypothetical protein